jgi:hypothetical protein
LTGYDGRSLRGQAMKKRCRAGGGRGQIATRDGIEAAAAFCVLRRNNLKRAIIQEIQISVSCLANACGVAQDGLEYWVEFSPKRADDLQHFRSGMLLFPSFA